MREDLADLYVEATGAAPGEAYRSREDFLARLADDVRQPGFGMLVAETTVLAGCAFGVSVGRDGSWWLGFDGQLPPDVERLTASGRVFAITAIVVHPHERGRGLTGRMQQRLFADRHATLGATLLDPADDEAHRAFRSWGWRQIGQIWKFSDPAVLRVLVLPLGTPTA
jgi:GNAT superfamily N-acetyltransferase